MLKELTTDIKDMYYRYKNIAIFTFFISIFAYADMFINTIPNPDNYFFNEYFIAGNWEISLGRFVTRYIDKLTYGMNASIMISIIAIVIFILNAIVVCRIFEINNNFIAGIVSILIMLSPKTSSLLMYYFASETNAIGMLLCSLAIYLYKLNKRNFIISILCIVLSLGIYQASIAQLAFLSLGLILVFVMSHEDDLYKKICWLVLIDVIGIIFYYVVMKVILKINNLELADYRGTGNVSISNMLIHLPDSIIRTYKDFFDYFFGRNILANAFSIIKWNYIFFCISLFSIIIILNSLRFIREKVLFILGLLVIPILCGSMIIVNPDGYIDVRTTDGYMFIIPLFIKFIFEAGSYIPINKIKKYIIPLVCIIGTIISFKYLLSTNANCFTLKYSNRQVTNLGLRIVKDIEDNYPKEYKLNIIGAPKDGNYPIPEYLLDTVDPYAKQGVIWGGVHPGLWRNLLHLRLGVDIVCDSDYDAENFVKSDVFKNAPLYPNKGSIINIDDSIYVKVSEVE